MKKIHIKLILDAIMAVLFAVLMDTMITGLLWHEVLGLAAGGMFLTHNLLNASWIKALGKRFFTSVISIRARAMYINAILLMVSVGTLLFTGILISKELFVLSGSEFLIALHHSSAWISAILLVIHVGLNAQVILGAVKGMLGITGKGRMLAIVSNLVTVTVIAAGIKLSFDIDLARKIIEPFNRTGIAISENLQTSQNSGYSLQITGKDTQGDSDSSTAYSSESADEVSGESLEDYLSKLVCTSCHKHCLLINPRCGKGCNQAVQAEAAYYSQNSTKSNAADME